jgi:hypothetical protein
LKSTTVLHHIPDKDRRTTTMSSLEKVRLFGAKIRNLYDTLGGTFGDKYLEQHKASIKTGFGISDQEHSEWEVSLSYVGEINIMVIHLTSGKVIHEDGSYFE